MATNPSPQIAPPTRPSSGPWPVFRSLASYHSSFLTADLIAGLTLAAIAIPEQMATAKLGQFLPQIGFFAFLAGSLGFAIFGSNRFLSCGADSTITPIFASTLGTLATGASTDYQMLAVALALTVGIILVAGSVFRLGWIANLLSVPVTVGFLAGISVHILVSQMPEVLGIDPNFSPDDSTVHRIAGAPAATTRSRQFLYDGHRLQRRACVGRGFREGQRHAIPGALIGLVGATGAFVLAGLGSKGVLTVGTVDVTWPALTVPDIGFDRWVHIVTLSLLIAIVVMVQTAATTRSFPSDPGQAPDVDRDFLGVGAGSILAALFGAFPVNASPPRTGIVCETGGRSQLSGLFAAAIVLALLAFGTALLQNIPNAALAGVLLFVALRIVRVSQIAAIWRQSRGEFLLIVATAAAIILLPIQQGVALGILLSLFHGVWSTTQARLVIYQRVPGTTIWWPAGRNPQGEHNPDVVVVGLQAPLSFLNATHFRADALDLLKAAPVKPKLLVIEASGILEIDFTAAQALLELINTCHADGIKVAMARLESSRAQDAFARFGITEALGRDLFLSKRL